MSVGVEIQEFIKEFPLGRGRGVVHAVNGVSLRIEPGETCGLVGESGSGKSTLGRCILRLLEPTSGRILFNGIDITRMPGRGLRSWRARTQIVFQDPYDSLDPRMRVMGLLEEPLRLHSDLRRTARRKRAAELLELVQLDPSIYLDRYPRELSGGEAQRVAIARAISSSPSFVVLDEPTASLDVSVRAGVLSVLMTLQEQLRLTYLLISHDLYTVAAYCNRVAVMYLGRVVEFGSSSAVFNDPQHPYTQSLLSASLPADPRIRVGRHVLEGEVPSSLDLPSGCFFASRCPLVREDCLNEHPASQFATPDHTAACVRVADGSNKLVSSTKRPARRSLEKVTSVDCADDCPSEGGQECSSKV